MNAKATLEQLDSLLENRIRLAVMAILAATDGIEFVALKTMLEVTDGNLATHVAALERAGYLRVRKRFAGKKPVTRYTITETGRKALAKHVDALEVLLRHADWSDGR